MTFLSDVLYLQDVLKASGGRSSCLTNAPTNSSMELQCTVLLGHPDLITTLRVEVAWGWCRGKS